jgi:pimeloyl-ACP methyl ester carboxylesterase
MDHFEHAGLRFDVVDAGDPDGEVVVLLHGFPQQPAAFDGVTDILHDHGLRTLVPAERGYPATARPKRRRDYTVADTAGDVIALLDAAEIDRAHVVGHDWGGAQAWAVAGLHPERVASLTVLSTPHPAAMIKAFGSSNQALRSWYMFFFQLSFLPEQLVRRTLARTLRDSGLSETYIDRYVSAMAEPGALTGALNWYRGIPYSLRQQVGRIRVPTTYVWGRHDFALGRTAAEATERYVSAPYTFVDLDAGHWLPETESEAVADAVLQRVRSQP